MNKTIHGLNKIKFSKTFPVLSVYRVWTFFHISPILPTKSKLPTIGIWQQPRKKNLFSFSYNNHTEQLEG